MPSVSRCLAPSDPSVHRYIDTQVGQEWEAHRAPLLNALREQKGAKAARVMKAKGMMDEIRSWRAEMQQMALDVREKEERVGILNDELSKLPKNLNRTL
jgi:hypothetical protein